MEDGGLEVTDVELFSRNIQSQIIGLTDDLSPADPAACHPEGERKGMTVASAIIPVDDVAFLNHGCPTKFSLLAQMTSK